MTDCGPCWGFYGLTTQASASSFKNFSPSWLTLFMGGESATKTFPINGRGEWKSLKCLPDRWVGFLRPTQYSDFLRNFFCSFFMSLSLVIPNLFRNFFLLLTLPPTDPETSSGWRVVNLRWRTVRASATPLLFYLSSDVKALRLIWNLNEPRGQSATEWR